MTKEKFEGLENALSKSVEYWTERATSKDGAEALLFSVQALVTLESSRREALSGR